MLATFFYPQGYINDWEKPSVTSLHQKKSLTVT